MCSNSGSCSRRLNRVSLEETGSARKSSRSRDRDGSLGRNCRPVRKFAKSERLTMEEYRKMKDEADMKCPKKYKKRPKEKKTYNFIFPQEVVEEEEECEPLPSVCGPLPCCAPPIASFKEQIQFMVQCVHDRMKADKLVKRRECPDAVKLSSKTGKCCKQLPRPLGMPGCCKCCKCEDPPSYSITLPKSCGGFMDDEDDIVISDLQDQCCPPLEILQPTFNDFMGIMDMSYDKIRMGSCGSINTTDDEEEDDDDDPCLTKNPCAAMEKEQALKDCMCNGGTEPCGEEPEVPKLEGFFGCENDIPPERMDDPNLCN